MTKQKFCVKGMSCAACVNHVEKAVKNLDGVNEVSVSLLTNSMTVEFDSSLNVDKIIDAVTSAGYTASLYTENNNINDNNQVKNIAKRLIISICFLLPLMYVSMGYNMFGFPLPNFLVNNPYSIAFIQMALALTVIIINKNFYINGVKSIIKRAPNMDSLICIGSGASFIYSLVITIILTISHFNGINASGYLHDLYFESSAMILVLITVGKLLESYSKGKTTNALKGLMKLMPKTATIIVDGKEKTISCDELKVGDIFIVRPGERIPADAIIVDGETSIDQSSITGESVPVDKSIGDTVKSATLNVNGSITCKAIVVGKDTSFAKIIELVENTYQSKAPIQKIADKVSGIFVPIVMSIALVTLIVWLCIGYPIGFSLSRAIGVLVISCPCALGLATPVAIVVGSGIGAKHGILFKNATTLENAGKIDFLVFDKTGTLTTGKMQVSDVFPFEYTKDELLQLAYSLESKSEHPLAKSIIEYCENVGTKKIDCTKFKAHYGKGVSANINEKEYFAGNVKFITQLGIPIDCNNLLLELAKNGKTPLLFCDKERVLGIIALADTIKPDALATIEKIKKLNIKTIMLTGDNSITANAINSTLNLDMVMADLLPEHKNQVVKKLMEYGRVAFVGDGVNDAPALALADVGIALSSGTDVAVDGADVVLLKPELDDVVKTINVSSRTLINVKENLFWAFFYNSLGIPIAAGVLFQLGFILSPMIGALAMSLSSFCVVLNALRLNLINVNKSLKKNKGAKVDLTKILKDVKLKEINNMQKTMIIEGMMCKHCISTVEKALSSIDGVTNVKVDLDSKSAVVESLVEIDNATLIKVVENEDFKVTNIK